MKTTGWLAVVLVSLLVSGVPSGGAAAAEQSPRPGSGMQHTAPGIAVTPAVKLAKPDLVVLDFDIVPGVGTPNVCNVVRLNLVNNGAAELPLSAYESTVAAGGVKIVVTRSPSTPVLSVMLKDADPQKRVKPAHSSLGQNKLFLPKFSDSFAMANGAQQTFTVTVDPENKVVEANDDVTNTRTEEQTCNVH